jgi:hypothetical protein
MRFRLIPRDEGFFDLYSQAAVNIDEALGSLRNCSLN